MHLMLIIISRSGKTSDASQRRRAGIAIPAGGREQRQGPRGREALACATPGCHYLVNRREVATNGEGFGKYL